MRIECWIPEATDTHTEYVTLIGFPRQKRLGEQASELRLYVNCLSFLYYQGGVCILRGTVWVYECNRLDFVLKELNKPLL